MTNLFVIEYNVIKEVHTINKIRTIRLEKGWTQQELADKSGVPQPTISQIEKGNRKYPTHETIKKIARALGVDIDELDEDNQTQHTNEVIQRRD